MDEDATIEELKRAAVAFRDKRNWKQFHDAKNLAAGLAIEAAELQELFLWKSPAEVDAFLASEQGKQRLREEIADVAVFLLYLCEAASIDLSDAVRSKIAINEKKYPVDRSYNSNKKYNEL